jgi:aspartate racemase
MKEPRIRAQHTGIVGCSAEGAALCYRTVCESGAALMGPYGHLEVSPHTPSFSAYVECLDRGDWAGVAELMLASANKLARVGADFLICPDNTIHQALPQALTRSPLPWLPIAEVVADEAVRRGFRRLGLTGTRWLVAGPVYADVFAARGLELVRPTEAEREDVNRIIMGELVHGEFRPESIAYFQKLIRRMGGERLRRRRPWVHRASAYRQ